MLVRNGFALGIALEACSAASGATIADVDLVDVYSCFPVVRKLVALHLGPPREAPLSVTGGHSSFGGPLNSYSLHVLATTVERLRPGGGTGLAHANGGYLTCQHALVVETATVEHDRAGSPAQAFVVTRTAGRAA